MTDNRHIVITPHDGTTRVIPRQVFDQIVAGTMHITELADYDQIMRKVIEEWLTLEEE